MVLVVRSQLSMRAPTTLCSPPWLHKLCRIYFLSSLLVCSSQRSLINNLLSFDLLVWAIDKGFALCTSFDMSLKMTSFSEARLAILLFFKWNQHPVNKHLLFCKWKNIFEFSYTLMKSTFCCFWCEICGHMFSWINIQLFLKWNQHVCSHAFP